MSERLYFLGIGGTLMGGLAQLAKARGFRVSGCDNAIYPPMSDQLAAAEIEVFEGFDPTQLDPPPDRVVVGNARLPRGHPAIEHILNEDLPYTSGAQWLGEAVLADRWVIAVAGTHGKTTTASMVAWILECAGLEPGFMIGGVPSNFEQSARLGASRFFVVEADEYDTSYFDRRSKFVHYRPRTLAINNLEYDHADIFDNLDAIQTQFHHLIRTVPASGRIIAPTHDPAVDEVLHRGCWTPVSRVGNPEDFQSALELDSGEVWHAQRGTRDGSAFEVARNQETVGRVEWSQFGAHNVSNALVAVAAAEHAGVAPAQAVDALSSFAGVQRRLELFAQKGRIRVYDDFAHHPTEIRSTLQALRNRVGTQRIVAVVEPRTHTMSLGSLRKDLVHCCAPADEVVWFRNSGIRWDLNELIRKSVVPATLLEDVDAIVERVTQPTRRTTHVVVMSNGNFAGIRQKLASVLDDA